MDCRLLPLRDGERPTTVSIGHEGLVVSFRRTLRVPDTENISGPLPDLGSFPLYSVDQFCGKLPDHVSAKGGLFFPMYRREAMWIRLTSKKQFAVKVYVGDTNAVFGEPAEEGVSTEARRQSGDATQDYVVTPQQHYIDGLPNPENRTQQFVAGLGNRGYTTGTEIGKKAVTTFQFEVTGRKNVLQDEIYVEYPKGTKMPLLVDLQMSFHDFRGLVMEKTGLSEDDCILKFGGERCKGITVADCGIGCGDTVQIAPPGSTIGPDSPAFGITVTTLEKKIIPLEVSSDMEFLEVKELLQKTENTPADDLRLIYLGRGLTDHWKLKELDVKEGSNLHMVKRLRMSIKPLNPSIAAEVDTAAEGLKHQATQPDPYNTDSWDRASTTVFNVHILDPSLFATVTGISPPKCPIDEATYADLGMPSYDIPEVEPSMLRWSKNLKSYLSKTSGTRQEENDRDDTSWMNFSDVRLNPEGTKMPFRSVSERKGDIILKEVAR
ncbi:hypothetical protein FQN54_000531 [Arachnomyces sp. PD_36]|nr:hypothetical protein FQN54_000531 [Arachnomyces sp. PD_36]